MVQDFVRTLNIKEDVISTSAPITIEGTPLMCILFTDVSSSNYNYVCSPDGENLNQDTYGQVPGPLIANMPENDANQLIENAYGANTKIKKGIWYVITSDGSNTYCYKHSDVSDYVSHTHTYQ